MGLFSLGGGLVHAWQDSPERGPVTNAVFISFGFLPWPSFSFALHVYQTPPPYPQPILLFLLLALSYLLLPVFGAFLQSFKQSRVLHLAGF